MARQELLLRASNITKRFPGCVALDNVDFDVHAGEVHVLFGENGAGKTTLVKILTGVYPPDAGEVYIKGDKVELKSSEHARSLGVSAVYQEFSLAPEMSIVANLFLGREVQRGFFLDKNKMLEKAYTYLEKLKFGRNVRLEEKVGNLSLANQQIIEIAKGLMQQEVSVLILDEPTSALSEDEIDVLFEIVNTLKSEGKGIVYISHIMDEMKYIGDKVTILRDGKRVEVIEDKKDITERRLVKSIVPDAKEEIYPELGMKLGNKVLEVKGLSTQSGLKNITFDLKAGQICGFGGLPDSGKSNVGRALFGLEKITSGEVTVLGEKIDTRHWTPRKALRSMFYSPAEKMEGLVLVRDMKENQSLPSLRDKFEKRGFILGAEERRAVSKQIADLGIKPLDMNREVRLLSGGNQQKVIVARGFIKGARIFVFDEVTRGIDIAAKRDIYRLIAEIAKQGAAVIYIASEIPELLNLCHSIIAMFNFGIFKQMAQKDATKDKLTHYLFGLEVKG